MLTLGPLVFAAPWILAGLASLPVIYWLLRVTPPAPRRVRFPAIRLLLGLRPREETPDRTPLWLLILRLLIAALIVLALARPLVNPGALLPGSGPLLLVVDNGWAASTEWPDRRDRMADLVARAEREGRAVVIVPTARPAGGGPVTATGVLGPSEARGVIGGLEPVPWPVDHAGAAEAAEAAPIEGAAVVWLSDGLQQGEATTELGRRLAALGSLTVLRPAAEELPPVLRPPAGAGTVLELSIDRATASGADRHVVEAMAGDGRVVAREEVTFASGALSAGVRLDLPSELRNAIQRIDLATVRSAAAAVLLDDRWRRRLVGIVGGGEDSPQPLLDEHHYLTRALAPFADIRTGTISELVRSGITMLVLPDSAGTLSAQDVGLLERWTAEGGTLLRFAGPFLAGNQDSLLPVRLRAGDRILSGALTWTEPMPLAEFPAQGPLAGLQPGSEVLIERQVLAEPSLDLPDHTWARLTDGTPLVTAAQRGDGLVVLVHTTAGPTWSNLPLSGLFVDLLRRISAQGQTGEGATGAASVALDPIAIFDAYGILGSPPATALPIPAGQRDLARVIGPDHPPGYYGLDESRIALNLGAAIGALEPIGPLPAGAAEASYAPAEETDLMPWLLAAALLLFLIDLLISLGLRGLLGGGRRAAQAGAAVAAAAILVVSAAPGPAQAQRDDLPIEQMSNEEFALTVTNGLFLAYVETGDPTVDAISRAGLRGLAAMLTQRTAIEPTGVVGVNPAHDELAFFSMLYWPVTEIAQTLSPNTAQRVNTFLENGGIIWFDTGDQVYGSAMTGSGPGGAALRRLTEGLDIPPLMPADADHVLTRTFYLLDSFPGRVAGGDLWVEQTAERVNDGVSSVIIGSNDWARAWAIGGNGRPVFPVTPGGERQRELAYRVGINVMMYVMTGNYKADQVHVPAILERLGQ